MSCQTDLLQHSGDQGHQVKKVAVPTSIPAVDRATEDTAKLKEKNIKRIDGQGANRKSQNHTATLFSEGYRRYLAL